MVLDEVFARHAAVHRVPVTELSPQLVQGGLGDAALVGVLVRLAVNIVPHFQCQLLRPVRKKERLVWVLVIALRPQTPKHIRGGWSHYTDTSKPVDGNGGSKYGHCPIRVSNQGPIDHRPNVLTTCAIQVQPVKEREREKVTQLLPLLFWSQSTVRPSGSKKTTTPRNQLRGQRQWVRRWLVRPIHTWDTCGWGLRWGWRQLWH
jgi:hypothetical protein